MITLDKLDLGIAAAILRTHAELSDFNINKLIESSPDLDDDVRQAIIDLEEDRDVLNDIADKMKRMEVNALAHGEA
jgi:hypothetical protein